MFFSVFLMEHVIAIIAGDFLAKGIGGKLKNSSRGLNLRDQMPFQQAFLFLSYQELTYSPPLIRLQTNLASQ